MGPLAPDGPLASMGMERAVVRAGWTVRVLSLLLALFALGLWPLLLRGVRATPGTPWPVLVGVTVLLWALALASTLAVWGAWWFRGTVSTQDATVRLLGRTSRLRREHATSVRLTGARSRAWHEIGASTRLTVSGTGTDGRCVRVALDPTMTGYSGAVAVLATWVRLRPGLADEETLRYLVERTDPDLGG